MTGHAQRVSFDEVRQALRLARELAELPHDRTTRLQHLGQGLLRMFGANVVSLADSRGTALHEPVQANWLHVEGAMTTAERASLMRFGTELLNKHDMGAGPIPPEMNINHPGVYLRPAMMPRSFWLGSPVYQHYMQPAGCDEWMIASRPANAIGFQVQVYLNRDAGERAFRERERRLLMLLIEELGPLIDQLGMTLAEVRLRELPPALRAAYDSLCTSASEKQIAHRLNITPTALHKRVSRLYRRLDVSSRAELLATYPPERR